MLPAIDDFALSKLKKNQKIAAVVRPKRVCAERIPIAVVFALRGSIGMLEKFTVLYFWLDCCFFILANSV